MRNNLNLLILYIFLSLPWINERMAGITGFPGRHGFQSLHNPPAGVGRIDHGVNFQIGGHVNGLASFVELGDKELIKFFPFLGIFDSGELFLEACLDGASRPIPPNSPVGQAAVKKDSWNPPLAMAMAPSPYPLRNTMVK